MCVSKLIFHFMGEEFRSSELVCIFHLTYRETNFYNAIKCVCGYNHPPYTLLKPHSGCECANLSWGLSIFGSWLQRGPVSLWHVQEADWGGGLRSKVCLCIALLLGNRGGEEAVADSGKLRGTTDLPEKEHWLPELSSLCGPFLLLIAALCHPEPTGS